MTQIEYVPGVCNIGPQETARRRNLGWISLGIGVVLLCLFIWAGISPWWRLLIFFPITLSASGFLQAYFHFCSGFARTGVFNFGSPGNTTVITDEASKAKDRRKGSRITMYAALIGVVVAIGCVFL